MSTVLGGNGYVVYKKERNEDTYNTEYYWFRTHEEMAKRLDIIAAEVMPLLKQGGYDSKNMAVADILQKYGEAERRKEIKLLRAMGLTDVQDDQSHWKTVRQINEIMVGKQAYKRALEQIKYAKDKLEGGKKTLAPTISSLYVGYLTQIFGNKLNNYIEKFLQSVGNITDIKKLDNKIDWKKINEDISIIYDEAIEEALRELFKKNPKVAMDEFGTYWTKEEYDNFLAAINDTHIEALKQRIHSRISLDEIQKTVKKEFGSLLKKNKNKVQRGGRTVFEMAAKLKEVKDKKNKKNESDIDNATLRVASIGGSVNEVINMIRNMLPGTITVNSGETSEKKYNRAVHSSINERQKIDTTLVISTLDKDSIENIFESMEAETGQAENLIDAEKKMSDFYEKHLKNLDDTFVIFSNTKAYTMNTVKTKGFSGGGARRIDDLQVLLTQGLNVYSVNEATNLIDYIKNTIHNAYLDSDKNRSEVLDGLKNIIRVGMVHLLFDDWVTIGKEDTGGNAIHVFTLDDVNIPASYLFIGAAKAYRETVQGTSQRFGTFFSLSLKYPKDILYPEAPEPIRDIDTGKIVDWQVASNGAQYPIREFKNRIVPNVREAWEKQKQDIASNFTFSYHFLRRFYLIIESIIEELKNSDKPPKE